MSHASNGSVEGAEYANIHDRLDALEAMKNGTVEAEKEKQELLAKKQSGTSESSASPNVFGEQFVRHDQWPANSSMQSLPLPLLRQSAPPLQQSTPAPAEDTQTPVQPASQSSPQTLEERVQDLRRQVERLVKSPGAPLKSAPFHSASTLQTLPSGEQVLVEISTPYWLGVETHAGQHGWIQRDELESLP